MLAAHDFQYRTWPESRRPGARPAGKITDPKDAWQMDDAQADEYYKLLHIEHLSHGFTVPEFGYCPLLMAEHEEIKAGWAICDAAEYITGITRDRITATLKFREYLDLVCGLVCSLDKEQRVSAVGRQQLTEACGLGA